MPNRTLYHDLADLFERESMQSEASTSKHDAIRMHDDAELDEIAEYWRAKARQSSGSVLRFPGGTIDASGFRAGDEIRTTVGGGHYPLVWEIGR